MQNIILHIAYLLTKHECVIISGFGAFVTSIAPARKVANTFYPPVQTIGFNSEITHNDGILVNSIAKGKNVSYKEASRIVNRFVDDINFQLKNNRTVSFAGIGNLALSTEGKIIFTPYADSLNVFGFGYHNFQLPLVKDLEAPIIIHNYTSLNKDKKKHNLHFLKTATNAAAAALVMLVISTPLNNSIKERSQYASIVSLPKREVVPTDTIVEPDLQEEQQPETEVEPVRNARNYFIVIASLPTREMAEKTLQEIQANTFESANIVSCGDKHRIYLDRFTNKEEAENFLDKFRTDHPAYQTAWLLGERAK